METGYLWLIEEVSEVVLDRVELMLASASSSIVERTMGDWPDEHSSTICKTRRNGCTQRRDGIDRNARVSTMEVTVKLGLAGKIQQGRGSKNIWLGVVRGLADIPDDFTITAIMVGGRLDRSDSVQMLSISPIMARKTANVGPN